MALITQYAALKIKSKSGKTPSGKEPPPQLCPQPSRLGQTHCRLEMLKSRLLPDTK